MADLAPHHRALIEASAIAPDVAAARGYRTIRDAAELRQVGFPNLRTVPGLIVPIHGVDGRIVLHQYRPDLPRVVKKKDGRTQVLKYETPRGASLRLDVPPAARAQLGDPSIPLWITEGARKADAAVSVGLCCIALLGVWGWRGRNAQGGTTALADWESVTLKSRDVIVCFDSDVMTKPEVQGALHRLTAFLESRGARVRSVVLPDDDGRKVGLDDYLAQHSRDELLRLVPERSGGRLVIVKGNTAAPAKPVTPRTLDDVHCVFRRWLGEDYDLDAIDLVLATAAVERMDGDPLWTLLISGPGAAKTETVQALSGAGAIVTSTITSEGALLSATPSKNKGADAHGGLLRRMGSSGTLVLKDVTTVLSMNRDTRSSMLAAWREIYDGKWERNVGTDGGRTIAWTGRIALIGACTTAWDRAHDVISSLGDRFVLLRMDSTSGRLQAGRQALANTGREVEMRAELAEVVGGALARVRAGTHVTLTDHETASLLAAANVVTLCRTGVDYDYRGDVIDAHAPEMPTRFLRQLQQVVRGGVALGMDRQRAVRLALRCARDSMPPLRLAILRDVAAHPGASTSEVRKRLNKPRNTVDRQLQALQMLGVLDCEETPIGDRGSVWRYTVAAEVPVEALDVPEMSVNGDLGNRESVGDSDHDDAALTSPTDISGTSQAQPSLYRWEVPPFDPRPV